MKLLVILLCLFSERFLIHSLAYERFSWFPKYTAKISESMPENRFQNNPLFKWIMTLVPLLLGLSLVLYLFGGWFWGLFAFFMHLFVFHYCLGPDNPFYPPSTSDADKPDESIAPYFANVNPQLFTPIFWYLLLGPVFLLFYRLNDLLRDKPAYQPYAIYTANAVEWIPARLTALSYLLAGHFQRGFKPLRTHLFAPFNYNKQLLQETGVAAAFPEEQDKAVQLFEAEALVEQALIVYLVFFAILTIAIWF